MRGGGDRGAREAVARPKKRGGGAPAPPDSAFSCSDTNAASTSSLLWFMSHSSPAKREKRITAGDQNKRNRHRKCATRRVRPASLPNGEKQSNGKES